MGRDDAALCFRVLYTRHLTKKLKTYHDGFLKIATYRSAVLYDEDGQPLSRAKLKGDVTRETEGMLAFHGFLVNCDETCTTEEIPKNSARASKEDRPSCPRPRFDGTLPQVGLKRRKGVNDDSDEEVLDLFLNPAEVPVEKRPSKRAPFKRPAVKDGGPDGTRFGGDAIDLRFLLFGRRTERHVQIPNTFPSHEVYGQIFKAAMHEEMQLRLDSFAAKLRTAVSALEEERKNEGTTTESTTVSTTAWLRRSGIEYYPHCKIQVFKKDRREEDLFFLELQNLLDETKKTARSTPTPRFALQGLCRKHDVWVVSPDPVFLFQWLRRGRRGLDQGSWVAVFGSAWHGVTKEGKLQLELLSKQRPWRTADCVFAVRGPPAGSEMTLWEAMSHVGQIHKPLRDALVHEAPPTSSHQSEGEATELAERFRLNADQIMAVQFIARWRLARPGEDAAASKGQSVCLIHGPFGTGKSSLLVALIHLLTVANDEGNALRVLMCAHTNKAVDRIMEGLLASGYTDLVRIGLLDRIARSVLPHSIYYTSEASDSCSTASELKRQLQTVQSAEDEKTLKWVPISGCRRFGHGRQELEAVEKGVIHKRREKLMTAAVVGVTCCSANSAILQGLTFDVVVLDEACQIIEPLGVLPLVKTEAKYLIAAGDPCQLPAVIASPSEPLEGVGLARSLFSRLQSLGHVPCMLRTQYRCHPDLCRIPNRHFYEGKLIDGCSREDRPALIPDWPALCLVKVSGTAVKSDKTHSYWNKSEALAVLRVLKKAACYNLLDCQIGVICFYRAQVKFISSLLAEKADTIQVATVDSFQGMEKDIIVLSMSVDSAGSFASDAQRLNVALTRARHHLVVVGDPLVLSAVSPCLQTLVTEAKEVEV